MIHRDVNGGEVVDGKRLGQILESYSCLLTFIFIHTGWVVTETRTLYIIESFESDKYSLF